MKKLTLTIDIRERCGFVSNKGTSGEKLKCGGDIGFDGDDGTSGGADIEVRLRRADLRGAFFGGRTGDEDSAPDWKTL